MFSKPPPAPSIKLRLAQMRLHSLQEKERDGQNVILSRTLAEVAVARLSKPSGPFSVVTLS